MLLVGLLYGVLAVVTPMLVWALDETFANVPDTMLVAFCYPLIYLGLPTALFSPFTHKAWGRWMSLISIPLGMLFFTLLPMMLGIVLDISDWEHGRHIGNVFWAVDKAVDGNLAADSLTLLVLLALCSLLPNAMRAARGVHEVLAASAARRAGEANGPR